MVYTVRRKILQAGAKIEQREHPWASEMRARRIARDHIQKYGPGYYASEKITERIIEATTKKMGAKPIKRRRPIRRFNPLTDSPF